MKEKKKKNMGKVRKIVNKQRRKRNFPSGYISKKKKTKTRKKGREILQVTKHMLHQDQKENCQAFESHVTKEVSTLS